MDVGDSASQAFDAEETLDDLPPERRAEIEFVLAAGGGDEEAVTVGIEDGVRVDAQASWPAGDGKGIIHHHHLNSIIPR